MKSDIPVDYNFKSEKDAADAMRVLQEAGFAEIELSEDEAESESYSDVGLPPPKLTLAYLISGISVGMILGVSLFTLIFMVPAILLETENQIWLLLIAILMGGVLGGGVGFLQTMTWAKRIYVASRPHRPPHHSGFLLRVWVDDMEQKKKAKRVLGRFVARQPSYSQ
jgi:hypothetical protein